MLPLVAVSGAECVEALTLDGFTVRSRSDTTTILERDARGVFVIGGERVERLAAMTDFESEESVFHFEQVLAKMGVDKRLHELGIKEGDTVRVLQREFTFS